MVFGDHVIGKERLGLASGLPASRFLSFLSLCLSLSSAFAPCWFHLSDLSCGRRGDHSSSEVRLTVWHLK